jgi:hypothetical protein
MHELLAKLIKEWDSRSFDFCFSDDERAAFFNCAQELKRAIKEIEEQKILWQ